MGKLEAGRKEVKPASGIGRRATPLGLGLPLGFGARSVRELQSEAVKRIAKNLSGFIDDDPSNRTEDPK